MCILLSKLQNELFTMLFYRCWPTSFVCYIGILGGRWQRIPACSQTLSPIHFSRAFIGMRRQKNDKQIKWLSFFGGDIIRLPQPALMSELFKQKESTCCVSLSKSSPSYGQAPYKDAVYTSDYGAAPVTLTFRASCYWALLYSLLFMASGCAKIPVQFRFM